jgi:hypothetical protein
MQEWILDKRIDNSDDIAFINGCGIDYRIDDPSLLGPDDSGWCDAGTGQRIPTPTMRVIFDVTSKRDLLSLKLKYGNDLEAYTFIVSPGLPE